MAEIAWWPWLLLAGLGAFHGINPAMGWLFAVALGIQEQRGDAVWKAVIPLGVGHGLAIGAALVLAALAGLVVPLSALKLGAAVLLCGVGLYRLARARHPRWGGMRVGMVGLAAWSFIMASAHGAGLMAVPIVLAAQSDFHPHGHAVEAGVLAGFGGTLVHTSSYLLVTGLIAWVVYEKVGLGLLRKTWVNFDLVWALALIATGAFTLLI